jgi:hypothetical protein
MGTANFPFPSSLQQAIEALNQQDWNLSVIAGGRQVYIRDGDQLQFTAGTMEEAAAFVAGIFLATYEGRSLNDLI